MTGFREVVRDKREMGSGKWEAASCKLQAESCKLQAARKLSPLIVIPARPTPSFQRLPTPSFQRRLESSFLKLQAKRPFKTKGTGFRLQHCRNDGWGLFLD